MKQLILSVLLVLAVSSCASRRSEEPSQQPPTVEKNYIGHSREECVTIQVQCIPGFERFDDEKGCGCQKTKTP